MEELSFGGVIQKYYYDYPSMKLHHRAKFQLSRFKTV